MPVRLSIISHSVLCSSTTYLYLCFHTNSSRWLRMARSLYILYSTYGVIAYARNERRSCLNAIYNKLHDICYVCGSALTNLHLSSQLSAHFPTEIDSFWLRCSNVFSFSLPVFCFTYHCILQCEDYELTQSLCKASAFVTILLGGSVNSGSFILSGIFYYVAYECEVLKKQIDSHVYFRNGYNFLISAAQMLL
ncbi:hypothetical protein WDU94_004220 [Cyamophila willieti]